MQYCAFRRWDQVARRRDFAAASCGQSLSKRSNFRFHDSRHSTASYLAMNGASLVEIADVLGHKTLQMVKRYAHLSESHVKELVERVNDKILPVQL